MLKCWKDLKSECEDSYKQCIDEGMKQPGAAGWLVLRTWGDLELLASQIEKMGVGYNPSQIYQRLTVCERVLVENLLRTTNFDKIEKRKSNHKANAQRSERWCKWHISHAGDLEELKKLQAKCARKAPPNMDGERATLDSILN